MKGIVQIAARLVLAGKQAYERKWSFLGIFAAVFFGSIYLLAQSGLLPDPQLASAAPVVAPLATTSEAIETNGDLADVPELPTQVVIPAINLSVIVANPDTTDVNTLDGYLLKGAVRYPTSAELGEDGNVVIFGHSSYLPIVGNQAYKTFDGIQKLAVGDLITVYSSTTSYTYSVQTVSEESSTDAAIPLTVSGRMLTLSTCDSFAEKTDRFVVTATFVGSQPIAS
jgi:LPXTG-site transpeptidase (sortase) family protein